MGDSLKATHEKDNFQRLARLLFCGGRQLLKEVFDSHFSPIALTPALQRFLARPGCSINPRERSCLNPSPGVYGKSADFDITLLFKLVRHLCNLPIPATGWDSLPNSADNTLSADLARIKFYRNEICHDNNNMEIDDATFLTLWQEISEAIVRIAESISDEKGNEWKTQIDSLLNNPLTVDEEMEIKKELQDVKSSLNQCTEEIRDFREEVRESLAALNMKIDSQKISRGRTQSIVPDSVEGSAGYQDGTQGASLYPHPPVTPKQILSLIALYYVQVKPPSSSSEFSGFCDYMKHLEVEIQNLTIGSLLITLNISTLPILERLWEDYCSGHLGEVVQNFLATDEIMYDLGLTELKLKTTILEEDYKACKQSLKEFADKDASGIEHCTISPIKEQPQTSTKRSASEALTDASGIEHCTISPIKEKLKTSTKRSASEALTGLDVVKVEKEESAFKHSKLAKLSGGGSDSEDASCSGIVHHNISSIQEEQQSSTKRTASEAFTGVDVVTVEKEDSAFKHRKLNELSGGESDSEASNGEFNADIVFALDYSSSVTDHEFQKEINFAEQLAESWNVTSGYSKAAFVVYGDTCQTVLPFNSDDKTLSSVKLGKMKTKNNNCRRMDLALKEAANNLHEIKQASQNQHQLVVLITTGKQLSNLKEPEEDENDRLLSAAEVLSSSNIKVIIVPVGLETDFKQLGLIVKRPQSLFPLTAFDELTPPQANKIASVIKRTIDIDAYTKNQFYSVSFSGIPPDSGLWEKISLCSDAMEGAWYLLYDDLKKSRRPEKVKSLIRESIDNFHNTLVSDSKVCISLAVFGPLGAGKSFFLNFLLNHGLCEEYKVENGPLPSASGGSQTPLPIYIKYGKKVQVLLHKQKKGVSPDVWFSEEELANGTLARVNNLLKKKFEKGVSSSDIHCIELQGPFPVFCDLKERAMTTCGHLELEVDVEFVDVPGLGDETGNDSINIELSKADVVLFFDNSKSGRPVSAEDIAQIFRRRDEFEFTSRPKLVHVVNDRGETSSASSCDFNHLRKQKMKDLERAWSNFLPSGPKDEETASDCYQDVRKKLPQLNGEAVLEKLSQESEVIYFHSGNSGLIKSLKNAINDHVYNVKIKETIHPFLQNVHWAAKKLRTRIGKSLTTEKKKSQPHRVKVKEDNLPNFEMLANPDQVSDFVSSLNIDATILPQQYDIGNIYKFLYDVFLISEETLTFLLERLKVSLENFRHRLIEHYKNENWSASRDMSELIDLGEVLSESRVQQYCTNSAPAYLLHVLEKRRNKNPFGKYKKRWSSANYDERKDLCDEFLSILLQDIMSSSGPLEKEKRDQEYKKSHFRFMSQLKQDVKDLFAFGSLEDDASRLNVFKLLNKPIDIIIKFCSQSIREINPHPSLDVQADISLPEKMKDAREDSVVPLQSSHSKIIKEMTGLLLKPATKGAEAIRKLESKLSLGKGALVPRQSQSAEQQRLWAKALVNILSDQDHFNIPLDPSLILDHHDPEVDRVLSQARKRLFAHEKSSVTCKKVIRQDLPDNEIHVKKGSFEEHCLEVWVSPKLCDNLDTIHKEFVDPMQQVAPIFMPTIRPGPTPDIRGNFFLEEDPWSKDERINDVEEEDGNRGDEGAENESKTSALVLNIFLVVEKQHLETIQSTVNDLESPAGRNIKLMYVVLPQKGRGIGVTRAIIKSLAECLKFPLYWTIDDDIQFMYQFDGNDRRWHKCSLVRGLLFGQRVFQTCQEKTVKELSADDRDDLFDDVTSNWPSFAKKTKRSARTLLIDHSSFLEVQRNPSLLHSPFNNISKDCDGDPTKEEEMKACEQEFVNTCRKRLFEDTLDHIAGVSIAHESTKRYDYTSKYPAADYMQSEQRYQVVLNNTRALKERNFVTDEIIFHEDEFQIYDKDQRNTPYWGIRGSDKSFCHALTLGGVIGYQVIRVVHSHKKLTNVFDRVGPSYIGSQSPFRSEDEDEVDMDVNS